MTVKCPKCGGKLVTRKTESFETWKRRRYECASCKNRYWAAVYERIEIDVDGFVDGRK